MIRKVITSRTKRKYCWTGSCSGGLAAGAAACAVRRARGRDHDRRGARPRRADQPAGAAGFLVVLDHGAGGTPDTADAPAVRDAARDLGGRTALVTQPDRVKGARPPVRR